MSYCWTITVDLMDGAQEGLTGPRGETRTQSEIVLHPDGVRFRLLDGDGELYYEGVAILPEDASGFEPLEDFGTPYAGCVAIQLKERGRWNTL